MTPGWAKARAVLSAIIIVMTLAVGIGWAWPTGSLWWLISAIPGVGFLLLTIGMSTEEDTPSGVRSTIGPFIVMMLAWFGGEVILSEVPPQEGLVTTLWLALNHLWPAALVTVGVVRWICGKIGVAARRQAVRRATVDRELAGVLHEQRIARAVNQPSLTGHSTGFEPALLALAQVSDHRWSYGEPTGRTESFVRALSLTGLHTRFATFWSYGTQGGLVDCVVVTGRRIVPLDVEDRIQGDVTWLMADGEIRMVDNATGGYVGGPQPASVDVSEAARRIRGILSEAGISRSVTPKVVFLPTEHGLGRFEDLRWPGGVPAIGLDQALSELAGDPDFESSPESDRIIELLRGSTGQPLATYDPVGVTIGQPLLLPACACGVPYEEGMTYCLSCGQVRI